MTKQVYELGFILLPTLTEAEVSSTKDEIRAVIQKHGEIISEGETFFIDLAYEMIKKIKSKNLRFDQGYFTWIKFTAEGVHVNDIAKAVDAHDSVLRTLVVKTVEDDALTDLFIPEEVEERVEEVEIEIESDESEAVVQEVVAEEVISDEVSEDEDKKD